MPMSAPREIGLVFPWVEGQFGDVGVCGLRKICYRRFGSFDSVKAKWRLFRLCTDSQAQSLRVMNHFARAARLSPCFWT